MLHLTEPSVPTYRASLFVPRSDVVEVPVPGGVEAVVGGCGWSAHGGWLRVMDMFVIDGGCWWLGEVGW